MNEHATYSRARLFLAFLGEEQEIQAPFVSLMPSLQLSGRVSSVSWEFPEASVAPHRRHSVRWARPGEAGAGKRSCTALDIQPEHLENDPPSSP